MTNLTQPSVSIIIPCYNKKAYVADAIQSALAQTHACEVIVVDDGSTDGSLDEVQKFDGQIRWETGPNRGGSAARNRGLELANGEWIQFLDADDLLPATKVAEQLAELGAAPADALAFCPWSFFQDDGSVTEPNERTYWRSYDRSVDLLIDMWHQGGFFPPHVWLVSRTLIDQVGGWDETLTGDDDGEFFGRILAAGGALQFCQSAHALYRDPPEGSVSRNTSLKSALSFWAAFEKTSAALLAVRDDAVAQKACLSRARNAGYVWRDVPEVLDQAETWTQAHRGFNLSPSLPLKVRWLIAIFGLRRGLSIRRIIGN